MKLRDFSLFADENLFHKIVFYLRSEGFDVKFVREEQMEGRPDIELISLASQEGRVIITQDNDFGQIVFTQPIKFVGIIYLRPGHFPPDIHIETLSVILLQNPDLQPPFILTAENKLGSIRIKVRGLDPGPA